MRHNRVRVNKNNDKYHQSPHVGGIFVVVAIIASLLIPVLAVAEGEGTPEAPATSIEVQPTAVPTLPPPPPTAIPTQPPPPPTAVPTLPPPPPTAVPTVPPAPTAIPPTQAPAPAPAKVAPQPVVSKPEPTATVAPTATLEPSPTPSPTAVPSPTPSPTAIVWTNTDSLVMVDSATSSTLKPAAYATVTVRYGVTTPRVSTVIHAELTGDTRGWSLSSPTLGDADAVATTAVWTQGSVVQPGTSFDLPIVVTAPANVTADQTVSLHLWSVANTDRSQETGVAKVAQPHAQFTVIAPPPPTAVPSPTDVPVIEDEVDATDESDHEPASDEAVATPSASPDSRPELPSREEANESGEGEPVETGGVEVAASPQASPVAAPEGSEGEAGEEHDIDPVASSMASPVAEPQVSGSASRMLLGASGSNTCTPSDGSHMDPDTRIASFTCEFSKGPLVIEWVSQELSPGWKVNVDGQGFSDSPPEGKIGNGSDQEFSMQLRAPQEFVCDAEGVAGSVSFRAYVNPKKAGDSPLIKTTLSAICPTDTIAVPPTVSVEPFSFESLTWNGKEWGTTQGTANIEIHRDVPGERGVYDVQVQVTKTVYGLAPRVSSSSVVSENREGLSARMTRSDSDDDVPVTVAQVGPSFTGDGQVDVEYTLTPENDVPAGEHSMTIRVTVSNGD